MGRGVESPFEQCSISFLRDYSVSLLPETRTRGIEHVSLWRLASTQSATWFACLAMRQLLLRCHLSCVVNLYFGIIIYFRMPFFLAQSESNLDFVKGSFAVVFTASLDELKELVEFELTSHEEDADRDQIDGTVTSGALQLARPDKAADVLMVNCWHGVNWNPYL